MLGKMSIIVNGPLHPVLLFVYSSSNGSAQNNEEGNNQDMAALPMALALLQMGNTFEGDMRTGDIGERKNDAISQQNQTRYYKHRTVIKCQLYLPIIDY